MLISATAASIAFSATQIQQDLSKIASSLVLCSLISWALSLLAGVSARRAQVQLLDRMAKMLDALQKNSNNSKELTIGIEVAQEELGDDAREINKLESAQLLFLAFGAILFVLSQIIMNPSFEWLFSEILP